jgi:hypothetical protein
MTWKPLHLMTWGARNVLFTAAAESISALCRDLPTISHLIKEIGFGKSTATEYDSQNYS